MTNLDLTTMGLRFSAKSGLVRREKLMTHLTPCEFSLFIALYERKSVLPLENSRLEIAGAIRAARSTAYRLRGKLEPLGLEVVCRGLPGYLMRPVLLSASGGNEHDEKKHNQECVGCLTCKPISKFPFNKRRECYSRKCYDCVNLESRLRKAKYRKPKKLRETLANRIVDIRECIADGLTCREAALRLGVSASGLYGFVRVNGLPRFVEKSNKTANPVWSREKIARLAKFRQQRISLTKIGKKFGVSRNAISGAVHRYKDRFAEFVSCQ